MLHMRTLRSADMVNCQYRSVDDYAAPIMVDQNGVPTQLRGASTHGMHWFPQYVNQNAFQTLRDDWGINMVRLVCYPRDGGSVGYLIWWRQYQTAA